MPASSYHVLYRFAGGSDGASPEASLINVNGTLYGTTAGGGDSGCSYAFITQCGTVFSVTTTGAEKVLYSFAGGSDGGKPIASLINVNGTLYGTTYDGGGYGCGGGGCGTVFSVTPTGTEKVLYSFAGGSDGAGPKANLVNVKGKLYGTTEYGGSACSSQGCGTVFSITTTGTKKTVYSFGATSSDGALPDAGLINVSGTLYGTTYIGGVPNCFRHTSCGTVFSVTTSGQEKVLHSFRGGHFDGALPDAGLIDVNSTLYGTTYSGGKKNFGTAFSITTTGTENVLHSFGGVGGGEPRAGLINVKGTLFGTTPYSGADSAGTIFSVTPTGIFKVLHPFAGGYDGADPAASLINLKGTLYGTTFGGGAGCSGSGCGTVFAVSP